jgi:anti-sigma B factor antagonist
MDQTPGLIESIERLEEATVLRLAGDVDLNSSPQLRQALRQVVTRRPKVIVVNLGGVQYMDSSGLATLVEALKRIAEYGGQLRLVRLNPRVAAVFEISQLDKVFDVLADEQEAVHP